MQRICSANMLTGVLTREKKMKRLLFIYVACALMLAGCVSHTGYVRVGTLEARSHPQVEVKNGVIEVHPATLVFYEDEKDVKIEWELQRHSKYRFPDKDGIVIEGRLADEVLKGSKKSVVLEQQDEIIDCKTQNQNLTVICFNKHTRPGIYKYTIRLEEVDSKKLLQRDPPIMNW
jgi:hypothetical protein